MILDANGQPYDLAAIDHSQTEDDTARLAWLNRLYAQHPSRGLTPDRLHSLMVAAEEGDMERQLDLCEDMEERDGHLFAELDKRAGAVEQLGWSLTEPPGASAAEKKMTAQLREWIGSIPDFDDLVRFMMSAVLRGFANVELRWSSQSDGSKPVMLPSLNPRPHSWFTVDRETRNTLLLRRPDGLGDPLQPLSWISHLHRAKNGLIPRMGLVRVLAWPYLFKNFAVRDLAELLEIYGLPVRIGKYPAGASDKEKMTLLRAVTQIGHNAAGIIPQGMVVEFQKASEGSEGPFDSMQDRMEAIQSKVILGQTLTSGEGKHGTQALGTVHNDVRLGIRNSDARQCAATLTRQLVHPLALLNIAGADPRRLPAFVIETTEPEDLATYAEALPKLVQVGFKVPRRWAQEKVQIPEPEDGEDVLATAAAPAANPQAAPPAAAASPAPPAPPRRAALTGQAGQASALDDLVAESAQQWRPLMGPIVEPLLAELQRAADAGESLTSLMARLPQLIERMDGGPLAEHLARTSFSTRLAGAADLDL
ncbi:DUF935 domain-containing protein [Aquincola tertiaricarbonis]|uniref:DUF935 domain-containing protein n=1 Tax=Aquincola tertiaricarbonis TaxID=391953 RepID=A0ABY4S6C8_AQUTE|nr:DUF935 domain-containing protein [Aquincola tertiaricarbonis]URI06636.1 DUF935 domain-containing protein [Aquincola tertiaricarbonis]